MHSGHTGKTKQVYIVKTFSWFEEYGNFTLLLISKKHMNRFHHMMYSFFIRTLYLASHQETAE